MDDSGARRFILRPGETLADVKIEELELDPIIQRYLQRVLRIYTVADLTSKTARTVGGVNGIGPFRLQEIIDKLKEYGLCLHPGYRRGDPPATSPLIWLVDELGINIYRDLDRQNVKTIGDLLAYSESELEVFLRISAFHRAKIVRVLAKFDLHLRKE
jgi:DNA-directed RNA polymerase alpha subunit